MRDLLERYRLFYVLYGLVNACGSNSKTEHTDAVVLESLRLFSLLRDSDPTPTEMTEIEEQIGRIRSEKNKIVPDCAVCPHPCGNTSDLDPVMLESDPDDVFAAKKQLAELAGKAACAVLEGRMTEAVSEHLTDCCFRVVCWFGMEIDRENLDALADCFRAVGIL